MEKFTEVKEKPKIVVIGLDGATWDLIHPFVKGGKLPTFKMLLEKGSYAGMRSSIPYVTFPAWKCYSTGKNPGKLGVFWFARIDFKAKRCIHHNSLDFKSKELWDYLTDCGFTCGVINMPTTYPPKKVKGFMISGPPIPAEKNFTYPCELEKIIKEKYNYRVNPDPSRFILEEKPDLHHIEELLNIRFDITLDVMQNVDFLHTTIFYIDVVQHFYWNEKAIILRIYKKIDSFLKKVIKEVGEGYLFLVSDHGFGQQEMIFYVNEWLARKGYLVKKKDVFRSILPALLPDRQKIMKTARSTGIIHILLKIVPKPVLNRLLNVFPREGKFTIGNAMEKCIDWEKTRAFAVYSLIYINKGMLSPSELKKLKNDITEQLKNVRNNGYCIQKVSQCAQIYRGDFVDYGPDLVIEPEDGCEINHAVSNKNSKLWKKIQKGTHRRNGIFLAYGPDIKKAKETEIDIYDVAPTILHICGLPVPTDMDGRILKEIFEKDSPLAKRTPVYQPLDEKEKIRKKIEALKITGKL